MKGDMWEGGSRIPFIVSAPGYARGITSGQMVCFTDMMATLADLLGEELTCKAGCLSIILPYSGTSIFISN